MAPREQRLFHMLAVSLLTTATMGGMETLDDAAQHVWQHPQVLAELVELLDVLAENVTHITTPLAHPNDSPLCIHARYSRREIMAAFARGDRLAIHDWREGIRWFPEHKADVAAVTLDKSGKQFSPTTRYRDYAISPRMIHWESQSTTRDTSPTGQRYQQCGPGGTTFLLFARLTPDERAFWLLGPAAYVWHEGERPMAIRWKLEHPLPGDLYTAFAAVV